MPPPRQCAAFAVAGVTALEAPPSVAWTPADSLRDGGGVCPAAAVVRVAAKERRGRGAAGRCKVLGCSSTEPFTGYNNRTRCDGGRWVVLRETAELCIRTAREHSHSLCNRHKTRRRAGRLTRALLPGCATRTCARRSWSFRGQTRRSASARRVRGAARAASRAPTHARTASADMVSRLFFLRSQKWCVAPRMTR